MHIPRAICVPCKTEMTTAKSGVVVEMMMEENRPYYIISADRLLCPMCQREVLVGFAQQAMAEHYTMDYPEYRKRVDIQAEFA